MYRPNPKICYELRLCIGKSIHKRIIQQFFRENPYTNAIHSRRPGRMHTHSQFTADSLGEHMHYLNSQQTPGANPYVIATHDRRSESRKGKPVEASACVLLGMTRPVALLILPDDIRIRRHWVIRADRLPAGPYQLLRSLTTPFKSASVTAWSSISSSLASVIAFVPSSASSSLRPLSCGAATIASRGRPCPKSPADVVAS